MPEGSVAGVDGCSRGWIVAAIDERAPTLFVAPTFAELISRLPTDAVIALDMPVGLPARIRGAGRDAERAVRPLLRARGSSVFSVPARAAVEAGRGPFADAGARGAAYLECCRLARALSEPPRAVSRQSFALFGRILEVDAALRADRSLAGRVFESHPELAFAVLGDGQAARFSKHAPDGAGLRERRRILAANGIGEALLGALPPRGAREDDRLDACALLLVARRIRSGEARPHPDPFGRDEHGLPIAIWA